MSYNIIIEELDDEQREAATAMTNTVVSAGAGSGKTKVLAARYAYLIIEHGFAPDEILTLTFTRKAVSEMYSRIYNLLAACGHPRAQKAIQEFHKARIFTIDSFSAGIVRTACRRYGISPDFTTDDEKARQIARELAIPFIFEHRTNPAVRELLGSYKMQVLADKLFAGPAVDHFALSSPPDFSAFRKKQTDEIVSQWRAAVRSIRECADTAEAELKAAEDKNGAFYKRVENFFSSTPFPDIPEAEEIQAVLGSFPYTDDGYDRRRGNSEISAAMTERLHRTAAYASTAMAVSLQHSTKKTAVIKETLARMRAACTVLSELIQYVLQSPVTASVFPLMQEFLERFNRSKRRSGILTFADVARMAVDALSEYPDIRQAEKKSVRAVMIDEFQDDNALQRDLLFLLAEKPGRTDRDVPSPGELCPGKLFFVGDEKQSIYKFRGADVSVFRRLKTELCGTTGGRSLSLATNYRSRPELIHVFNHLFGGFSFPSPGKEQGTERISGMEAVFIPEESAPDYEASYDLVRPHAPNGTAGTHVTDSSHVHLCLLDKNGLDTGARDSLSADELEAVFTALKIRKLKDSGRTVLCRNGGEPSERPCRFDDICILFRSQSKQYLYEKHLRNLGIPYVSENITGFFADAPVNDLYCMLRLLVYPGDTNAYAAILRSPFVRASQETVLLCLLKNTGVPFDEQLDAEIPAADSAAYRRGRRLYASLVKDSRRMNTAELLTRLWYDEGYRYETVQDDQVQLYGELYDFFFELARQSDSRGNTLTDFLDHIGGLMKSGDKIENMDIPVERVAGVRLMTIHKSKGLEFPIVFVCGSGSPGRADTNSDPVFFDDEWGISLNAGMPEIFGKNPGNFFYNRQKEENACKRTAELRRLLYVAMTRAESELFITGSFSSRGKAEEDESGGEYENILNGIRASMPEKKEDGKQKPASFTDLLFPAVISGTGDGAAAGHCHFSLERIPAMDRTEAAECEREARNRAAAEPGASGTVRTEGAAVRWETARSLYAAAPARETPLLPKNRTAATSLDAGPPYTRAAPDGPVPVQQELFPGTGTNPPATGYAGLDAILAAGDISHADFGTLAHACIESRFTGLPPAVPAAVHSRLGDAPRERLLAAAEKMADVFFSSDLGKMSLEAPWKKSEYRFISSVSVKTEKPSETSPDRVVLAGQIDLIFDTGTEVHVVDFKTDSAQDERQHYAQLAAYRKAAADMIRKPVRCWLFYLRSGTAADVSDEAENVDLAETVLAAAQNQSAATLRDGQKKDFYR